MHMIRKEIFFGHLKRSALIIAVYPLRALASVWFGRFGLAQLENLVEGRQVAIVGNARSLAEKKSGDAIDEHEVVVRINRGPILSSGANGSKTTVLAASVCLPSGIFDNRGAKLLLWLTPKKRNFPVWLIKRKCAAAVYPSFLYRRLRAQLGARPSSGLMALHCILACKPASVTLFGFDGFASASLSGAMTADESPHDFGKELKYLIELERNDSRIFRS